MSIRDFLPATWNRQNVPVRRDDGGSNPFQSLQREMNRMFDRFFSDFTPSPSWDEMMGGTYLPKVDVKETGQEIRVEAELPGMDEKDIDISISENVLTLRGEKRIEREEKEEGFYRAERSYGKFHRDLLLPAEVETDKIKAVFKKGILTVHLPKKPGKQRKANRIEIKAS